MKRYFLKDFKLRTASELTEEEFMLYLLSEMDVGVELEVYDTEKHTVTFYNTRYPYRSHCNLLIEWEFEMIRRRERGTI